MMAAPAPQGPVPSDKVRSPCRGECSTFATPAGYYCRGCRRSLEEIASWRAYTDEEKANVLRAVAERNIQT